MYGALPSSSSRSPIILQYSQELSEVIQAVATHKELVAAQGLGQEGEMLAFCEESATAAETTTNTLPPSCI